MDDDWHGPILLLNRFQSVHGALARRLRQTANPSTPTTPTTAVFELMSVVFMSSNPLWVTNVI